MVADKPMPAANPLISEHQSQEAKWYQNGPALGGELKNPRAAMVERQEGDHAIDGTLCERKSPTLSPGEPMAIANTSPGTPPRLPFRNLPYPRNKRFAHREEILSEVHSTLQSGRQRVATGNIPECPAVALVGLGGIGKTQVALEYCYRHQDEYEVIIWLRAETPTQLVRDTQQVAQSWGLLDDNRSAGSPEDAWPKLIQRANSSWLIIYDNADGLDYLQPFWTSKACILITSRLVDWMPCVQTSLVVNPMSHDEGMDFLFQLLDRGSSLPPQEIDAASALTHELGGLPLAIEIMARQILMRRSSVAKFLALYGKHRDRLWSNQTTLYSTHTLSTVWASAFLQLTAQAEQLLWLLSVLHPDGVALELLRAAPAGEMMFSDDYELDNLLHELLEMAFVRSNDSHSTVVMHRLVQIAALQRCPEAKLIQTFSLAGSCILESLKSGNQRSGAHFASLMRHLNTLETRSQEFASKLSGVAIEELQELQTYVRERRWLMNHYSPLEPSSVDHESQEPEDLDWASTTTLVQLPTQHEVANDLFTKLFAGDPQFANSASIFLKLVSRETFERKCADLLSLLSVHLQDEPSSADLFQELKVFAKNVTNFVTAFEMALENVRLQDTTPENQHSGAASAYYKVIDATDNDGRQHSNVNILTATPGPPEQERDAHSDAGGQGHAQDIIPKHGFEGSGTTPSDFVSFILASEALQRFKKELDTQSQHYQADIEKSKRPRERLEKTAGNMDLSPNPTHRHQPKPVTITWKCRCGVLITDRYMEFIEGAVQAYVEERMLRHRSRANAQNTSPGTRGWFGPIRGMTNGISNHLQRLFDRRETQSKQTAQSRVAGESAVELPPSPNPTGRLKHLQLCISWHRRYTQTRYTSHSLNIESDRILYDLLRAQYNELLGPWKRLFSLRQISQIRFVKFRLRANKLVTIEAHSNMEARLRESLPRGNDADYDFAPPEPAFLPPIGHNEMMHYFYTPCAGQDEDLHIRRLPGHKLDPVPFQPPEEEKHVWGIELVESENRVWLYLSVPVFVVVFSSMVFGTTWTVVMHDIQGGFTVAGYIVASGLALLGSLQVFLENV